MHGMRVVIAYRSPIDDKRGSCVGRTSSLSSPSSSAAASPIPPLIRDVLKFMIVLLAPPLFFTCKSRDAIWLCSFAEKSPRKIPPRSRFSSTTFSKLQARTIIGSHDLPTISQDSGGNPVAPPFPARRNFRGMQQQRWNDDASSLRLAMQRGRWCARTRIRRLHA